MELQSEEKFNDLLNEIDSMPESTESVESESRLLNDLSCRVCHKMFSGKESLKRHEKIHSDEKSFVCDICGTMFLRKHSLKRHQIIHSKEKPFACSVCSQKFGLKSSLKRHMKLHVNETKFTCNICSKGFTCDRKLQQHMKTHTDIHKCEKCDKTFAQQQNLLNHMKTKHGPTLTVKPNTAFQPGISKFAEGRKTVLNIFSNYSFSPSNENKYDLIQFFNQMRNELSEYLMEELEEKGAIKWYVNLRATLSRTNQEGELEYATPHFRSKCTILYRSSHIKDQVEEAFVKINKSLEDFTQNGSGWKLDSLLYLEVSCATYSPLARFSEVKKTI